MPADPPLTSSPVLRGERVAFTGTLASMTHRQAQELVERHGGTAAAHVGRQTTMLVVGEEGWPLEPDGGVSKKLEAATRLAGQGVPVRVVSESDWLQLLGLDERRQEMSRLCTPAMLSQALGVPVGTIRRWHALGFLRPVKTVWRLPYFDFLEASAARKVFDLMRSGVSVDRLREAFDRLTRVLGRERFPQARLELMSQDARLVYRDKAGLLEPGSGQRVFDFAPGDGPRDGSSPDAEASDSHREGNPGRGSADDSRTTLIAFPGTGTEPGTGQGRGVGAAGGEAATSRWTAADWHREGLALLETGDVAAAVEAFRLALMERPDEPETHFALAEALYRAGHSAGALERYYCAVERDHDYVEAWVQLGCLHAELGRADQAQDAFRIALRIHPDYSDAIWHLAESLRAAGRTEEAAEHWRRYVEIEQRGSWAEQARQRLSESEFSS